jgi:branched-chain amino acid transport system permease protein
MGIWDLIFSVVTLAAIYALLTLALNLHFGMAGLINFGIVAYFAIGAYGYALVIQPPPSSIDAYAVGLGWPPWAGILVGVAAAVLFALITGGPTLRLRGEYLALTTFAFAEVLNSVLVNEQGLANGQRGLSSIFPPLYYQIPFTLYKAYMLAIALIILLAVLALQVHLMRSPFGATLRAIRDDELASQALGKEEAKFRLKAFLAGAAIAGLAGILYAWNTSLVAPGLFTADVTFTAFIALVLGGVGSNIGAVVGAFVLFGLTELLAFLPISADSFQVVSGIRSIVLGLIVVLILRLRPKGAAVR